MKGILDATFYPRFVFYASVPSSLGLAADPQPSLAFFLLSEPYTPN